MIEISNNFSIYQIVDPRDRLPFYVGPSKIQPTRARLLSVKPQYRPFAHVYEHNEGEVCNRKKAYSTHDVSPDQWMHIPVPPIVDAALFDTVAEQLQENRQRARVSKRGARYLLQGLIVCACCWYAYYSKGLSPSARKYHELTSAYYRCIGSDAYRFCGVRLCWNKQLRTDLVDEAVWEEVCRLLEHPERLEQEYRRRLLQQEQTPDELARIETRIGRLRQGIARLIDSYAEGLIEKEEFEPRVTRMRERLKQMEEQAQHVRDEVGLERELTLLLGRLDEFATRVKTGLHEALDHRCTCPCRVVGLSVDAD